MADAETEGPVPLDLLIVGMGPAGLSCALAAKQHGLRFACVDQAETIGGTVAAYPRKKLVMTQPMELPLHGKLNRLEYEKEELVELWQGLTKRHRLPVKLGVQVTGLTRGDDEVFTVATSFGNVRARHVVLGDLAVHAARSFYACGAARQCGADFVAGAALSGFAALADGVAFFDNKWDL